MEKNAKVTAVKILDIYEKNQYYIKIETETGTKVINVGEKTFNDVDRLTKNEKEVKNGK